MHNLSQIMHQFQDIKECYLVYQESQDISKKKCNYLLDYTSCNYATSLTVKTVALFSCKNNHITSCRLGGSTNKSDNHIFYCVQYQKQPFPQILTFMKLSEEQNFLFYEKLL